jgi:Flp pilus assembly protein TadG
MLAIKSTSAGKRQRGSALVEGALIFAIFTYMMIAVVDFGQFLFVHQTLTERAREGVRYGVVNDPTNSTSIQNIVLYGQASGGSVPNSPSNSDAGIFGVLRSQVTVSATGSATQDYRLNVKIQGYAYTIYSPLIHGSYNGPNIVASLPLGINF